MRDSLENAPATDALIRFSALEKLPESALSVMRLSFLDWVSVAIAGADEDVSRIVRATALDEGGAQQAAIIGSCRKLPARAAALVNGTISHALDYDDTHFAHIGHPSVAVVPAVLAVAEKTGASGRAALEAALIGCEASCHIGLWLGRGHYQHGFHQTATAGAFGATLAACRLLGLDAAQTGHAFGIVSTRASGLKSQFGTMGKPFHAGMAASNGVEAALLAKAGFVSRTDGIECAQGFHATHAGEENPGRISLPATDGPFLFETVQHKFHACCHGLHAALEAIRTLSGTHKIEPSNVTGIEITVHPRWLSVCNIEKPETGLEAKFSYRLTAAQAFTVTTPPRSPHSTTVCAQKSRLSVCGIMCG